MLGKLAIARRDLAFGTDAAPAADRIQIDAQLPRGGQDRRAKGKAAALARRGEDDKGVGAAMSDMAVSNCIVFLGWDRGCARSECGRLGSASGRSQLSRGFPGRA